MDNGEPEGGKWNYDSQNRNKLPDNVTAIVRLPGNNSSYVLLDGKPTSSFTVVANRCVLAYHVTGCVCIEVGRGRARRTYSLTGQLLNLLLLAALIMLFLEACWTRHRQVGAYGQ